MTLSFNLVREPWIPCLMKDGQRRTFGLLELLARAHEVDLIDVGSPLAEIALIRLLLAILHRSHGEVKTAKQWAAVMDRGSFDEDVVGGYLQQWESRFDLFDSRYPFYQVPNLISKSEKYQESLRPARKLIPHENNYGNSMDLFARRPEGAATSLAPGQAAIWLITLQQFAGGGTSTFDPRLGDSRHGSAGPLADGAFAVLTGLNLFETLTLNLAPYPDNQVFVSSEQDRPAWEAEPPFKYHSRSILGWTDWLTWQSHRIQLSTDSDGNVESFLLLVGVKPVSRSMRDPMLSYKGKAPKLRCVGIDKTRDTWRDAAALFGVQGASEPPVAVSELARRRSYSRVAKDRRRFDITVYGLARKNAAFFLNRRDVMPLPAVFLECPERVTVISEQLEACEGAAGKLFSSLKTILGQRSDLKRFATSLKEQAGLSFWSCSAESFDGLLADLEGDDVEAAALSFRRRVHSHALAAFQEATRGVRPSQLRAVVEGEAGLRRDLFRVFPELKKKKDSKK